MKNSAGGPGNRLASLGEWIGRSRFIVLIAVLAVLLVAISLFVLGTVQAVASVARAWADLSAGELEAPAQSVHFLRIVIVMLEAVVFFLVGVGLYSLFIAPLNVAVALGVETLNDLEQKITSVIVVILSVTFLERFIQWQDPLATLQFGAALAMTVAALFLFQLFSQRARRDQVAHGPEVPERSKHALFDEHGEIQDTGADGHASGSERRHGDR